MNLHEWLKVRSPEDQEKFFRQAAKFFSNRELSDIIKNIQGGCSLYHAHAKSGVLHRYSVDLDKLRREQ